jgi:tetratricopeptide (TPR) repeat protein
MRWIATALILLMVASMPVSSPVARQDDERLNALFTRLKNTREEGEARVVEALIWSIWFESGDAQIDRLLGQGNEAMNRGRFPEALVQFNAVVELDPKLAEGWNRRATLLFLMGDLRGSLADIDRTLALEPRHFGALSGLGLIRTQLEEYEAAIKAFEQAMTINPYLTGGRENLRDLRRKLGRDI